MLFIWPYNALPFLVTYVVSSAFSRRFGDYTAKWIRDRRPSA